MLFPSPIQVNNSLLPTRVFTGYRIKTVVFRMILICDVGFGLVYRMYCMKNITECQFNFITAVFIVYFQIDVEEIKYKEDLS